VSFAARTTGWSGLVVACGAVATGCATAGIGTRPGHVYGFDVRGHRLFGCVHTPTERSARLRPSIDAGATVDSYPALAADGTLLVGTEGGELLAIGGRR